METSKAIETLKQIAKKSQVANDTFHDFALRERARSQVTARALYYRMKKAGFTHTLAEYRDVLKALAECGFGTLKFNREGNVTGIFQVKVTLSSIGRSIVGKRGDLSSFSPRHRFSPISGEVIDKQPPAPAKEKTQVLDALTPVADLIRAVLSDSNVPAAKRVQVAKILLEK